MQRQHGKETRCGISALLCGFARHQPAARADGPGAGRSAAHAVAPPALLPERRVPAAGRIRRQRDRADPHRAHHGRQDTAGRQHRHGDPHGAGRAVRGCAGGRGHQKPGECGRCGGLHRAVPAPGTAAWPRRCAAGPAMAGAAQSGGNHQPEIFLAGPPSGTAHVPQSAGAHLAVAAGRGRPAGQRYLHHPADTRRAGGISGLRPQRPVPGTGTDAAGRTGGNLARQLQNS